MTDMSVLHGYNVFANKLDEVYATLPRWKQTALDVKLSELWEILETSERRTNGERMA